jgi:hypothetical protein
LRVSGAAGVVLSISVKRSGSESARQQCYKQFRRSAGTRVKAALAVLYDKSSAEYKKALEEIRAFDPSARI